MVHLAACSYHLTYVFQSESTLNSCLNVKELHLTELKFVYLPSLINLFTSITFAEICLHPLPITSSIVLVSMTKVDETDGSLHAFEYRKTKRVSDLNNSINFNCQN